jgi:hypothetical protein
MLRAWWAVTLSSLSKGVMREFVVAIIISIVALTQLIQFIISIVDRTEKFGAYNEFIH